MEGAVSLELDNDGPFSQRRSQAQRRQDDAPAWPVLARLPRVDGPGAAPPRSPMPTFAPEPFVGESPLEYLGPPIVRYADAPHPAPRHELHVEPVAAPAHTVPFAPPSQHSSSSRRYRFDQGDAAHDVPRSHRRHAEDEPSFSDAIFRAHAALVPHMGRISAAALLLAAGFVYWLAIGQQPGLTPPVDRQQIDAGLTQDVPEPSTSPLAPLAAPQLEPATASAAPEASVSTIADPKIDAPKIDAPVIEWTTPPRVAEAPAPIEPAASPTSPSPASPLQRTGDATHDPASSGPALTPPAPPSPAPAANTPSDSASAAVAATQQATQQITQTPAQLDNGITPTPERDVYPTTSFPPFDPTPFTGIPAMATAPTVPAAR
jgi:hypothetical protein